MTGGHVHIAHVSDVNVSPGHLGEQDVAPGGDRFGNAGNALEAE